MTETLIPWGPTGQTVYERTYSRKKADGTKETWPETAARVARGNLELVHGDQDDWTTETWVEYEALVEHITTFKILPGGRHLWASGVKGRQYLFNCHVAGWGEKLSDHFEFTFLRLMEGGGVGANYSSKYLEPFGLPKRVLSVHIVCDEEHPDYQDMLTAGLLSEEYDSDWPGAYEVADSREGWAAALTDLIDTYMTDEHVRHENRVYDVTNVRPKGARLKTFGGTASGPEPFARMMGKVSDVLNRSRGGLLYESDWLEPTEAMDIDHAIAECVVSGGNRRSARMAICHWDDPFIEDFLDCKADPSHNWTTNISVEIDQDFTDAIRKPKPEGSEAGYWDYWTRQGIDTYKTERDARAAWAHELHERVVRAMLTNGEPGYWNSTKSNVGEPNPVIATNPCGEIALEEWENCNLGHVNMDAFAHSTLDELVDAHWLITRFLMRATYGDVNDSKQAGKLARNRRIGVGHFGVQGYLAKNGWRYSEVARRMSSSHRTFSRLLTELYGTVRDSAIEYAHYLRIPVPVKMTTVAPTGTIAKLPGATEGIHPIYARYFERRVRFSLADADQRAQVSDAAARGYQTELDQYDPSGNTVIVVYPTKEKLVAEVEALGYDPEIVESADELSLDTMLAFQAMYQDYWADNAVSYTANVPAQPHQEEAMAEGLPVPPPTDERVRKVAQTIAQHLYALKGTTLMLDGSRPQAPYTRISEGDYAMQDFLIADGTDEECATGACPVR